VRMRSCRLGRGRGGGVVGVGRRRAYVGDDEVSIRGPRDALIHEGERVSPMHVSSVELNDMKFRRRDEIIDLAVEIAATAEAFPTR